MPRIVGGMFGLSLDSISEREDAPFFDGRSIFLANARSGISILCELLDPKCVWLPSFLCDVMINAAKSAARGVNYFPVDLNLKVNDEWMNNVRRGDLIILIDYFGFNCSKLPAEKLAGRDAWIVVDASQSLLSNYPNTHGDFVLFSPRKFLGVPDGGILTSKSKIDLSSVDLSRPPINWWLQAFKASVLRREFDIHGGDRAWFQIFQEVDIEAPYGFFAMSELSRSLLDHSFDYRLIAKRRRENYVALLAELEDIALFPVLPPETVPIGFPIRLKNRDYVRNKLIEYKVYPPIHWEIEDIVPAIFTESHYLSKEIMTIPCDQRYDESDMNRLIKLIRSVVRK